MRWFRLVGKTAAVGIASMALVGTTAVSAAFAAPATGASVAPAAHRTSAAPAAARVGVGQFRSWKWAQRRAGFHLMKPTKTYGLHRAGRIMVTRCEAHLRSRDRVATANYGKTAFRYLVLTQNNSGGPCQREGTAHRIRKVKVQGVTGVLTGLCGMKHFPRCKNNRKVWLFLTWRKHGVYYMAASYGEWQKTLIGFARHLVRVR